MLQLTCRSWIAIIALLSAAPAIAGGANFAQLTLALGFDRAAAVVIGHTGGSYSLSSIANRDSRNNTCIGYGDTTPDHILVLKDNFPKLTLQVDSGGKDTTLVVRGQGKIRCGDDTGDNKDASIQDKNWQAGTYEIWVGSMEPGKHWNYRLTAQQ